MTGTPADVAANEEELDQQQPAEQLLAQAKEQGGHHLRRPDLSGRN